MPKPIEKLAVIDGATLQDMRFQPGKFTIDTLLPQGISMLGGAPKNGKSWMVLDWCVRVAKGEPVWNLPVKQGSTLYLCLEDPLRRVQDRLLQLTDEAPPNAFFATAAEKLRQGLCEQIQEFIHEHPDTVLVAIDTFQIVRSGGQDISYASDYEEVRELKKLADELQLSILLVHHLRKQGASDPLNKLSGTTGISGAMDAIFILDRGQRSEGAATLVCTGRDIETRKLDLCFSKSDCTWTLVQDSLENHSIEMPEELTALTEFVRSIQTFSGSNTQLAGAVSKLVGKEIAPKSLKQMMNRWRYVLEEKGVFFRSHRSNGQRLVTVSFSSAPPNSNGSAASDATLTIRLTKTEKEMIQKKAKKAQLSITDFLVATSLRTEIRVAEDIKPLLIELKRIGNNINQIAMKINAGAFHSADFSEVIQGQRMIFEQLLRIAGGR